MRSLPLRIVVPLICALVAAVCGGGGSGGGPSGPSPDPGPPIINVFVGSVTMPGGGGGILMVRAAATLTAVPSGRRPLWNHLLDAIEPRLNAQSGTASGSLTLDDGDAVALSGTHSSGVFHLTGGAFSADVSVSGGSMSGTVSTPNGSAFVTPIGAAPAGPPSANPAGTYRGSYDISVDGYYTSHHATTGALIRSCQFRARITGTITARVYVPDNSPNTWAANVLDDWRETQNIDPACPNLVGPAEETVQPRGPVGFDYSGDPATIQGARTERESVNGLTNVRSHAFFGSVTAGGMEAQVRKAFRLTGSSGNARNAQGYPSTSVTITLVK